MKTAAIILNHNLPDWTDRNYKTLKPYERKDYDLMVFDNGSSKEGSSQYTSFRSDENLYFGGGFNAAMQMVLEDKKYDSLLFISNDLVIHPYNFVKTLRNSMFYSGVFHKENPTTGENLPYFDIVAPCFYNIEPDQQCHWKTMHNWGSSEPRQVPFTDFQCPLISKRLLKDAGEIDADLIYGWGIDAYFAILCKQKGYKMAVLDTLCILHYNSLTVKKGVANLSMADYCKNAEIGQYNLFSKKNLMQEFHTVRNEGSQYSFTK